ncbi:MAG: CBS domain-containing protein [Alphaproteobacteria bacterium]
MNVSSILREKGSDVVTLPSDASLAEIARVLTERKIGAVVVCGAAGAVQGIVSERDVVCSVVAKGPAALERPIAEIMTADVVTCDTHTSIDDLMNLMTDRRIRHIPVVEDGALKGIVSIGDIVKRKIAETEAEAEALKEYIATG